MLVYCATNRIFCFDFNNGHKTLKLQKVHFCGHGPADHLPRGAALSIFHVYLFISRHRQILTIDRVRKIFLTHPEMDIQYKWKRWLRAYPANTRRWPNVGLMLCQHQPALDQRLVSAEILCEL